MSKQLKQVINLSKRTGDRVIVFDNSCPEDSFVLMTLNQYEGLLENTDNILVKNLNKPAKEIIAKDDTAIEGETVISPYKLPITKEEEKTETVETEKSNFEKEVEKRDADILKNNQYNENKSIAEESSIVEVKKEHISDGPLKETLRNLLTEKKIVDKIDSIEKNNANLNGNRLNNWRIPPEIKEDSE